MEKKLNKRLLREIGAHYSQREDTYGSNAHFNVEVNHTQYEILRNKDHVSFYTRRKVANFISQEDSTLQGESARDENGPKLEFKKKQRINNGKKDRMKAEKYC